jgi:hypothetical protein
VLVRGELDESGFIHYLKNGFGYDDDVGALIGEDQLHLFVFDITEGMINNECPLCGDLAHHYVVATLTVKL